MTEDEVIAVFERCGGIVRGGHYVMAAGHHSAAFINKVAVYAHAVETSKICCAIAEHFRDFPIDVVAAPVMGGIVLTQWIAYHLSQIKGSVVLAVFADKVPYGNGFEFKRGYKELVAGKNVLVAEDILTTGGSARKVIDLTRDVGGNVVAFAALWNRGGVTLEDLGNPPHSFVLVNRKIDSWKPEYCPMCKAEAEIKKDLGRG